MAKFNIKRALRPALLAGLVAGLSGCAYGGLGVGAGYYGDGYVNGGYANGYDCDPYAPFDDYYACDSGYGFSNIGFGGGWYDNFYYPGYGYYVFDRVGTRHQMRNNDRRYWAHRRAQHSTKHARRGNQNDRVNRGEYGTEYRGRGRDLTPEQRAEWRERRQERRAYSGSTGRNATDRSASDGATTAPTRGNRDAVRAGRTGARGDQVGRGSRSTGVVRTGRPTMAQQQPQNRQPAVQQNRAAPAAVSRPAARPAPVRQSRADRPTRPAPPTAEKSNTRNPIE